MKEQPEGLSPISYGTLSKDGDKKVKIKVLRILNKIGR